MEATIVHISDLHLSNNDAWNNFNSLKEAILDLVPKPSLLVASGDFLDHPDSGLLPAGRRLWRRIRGQEVLNTMADVRTELEDLCRDCGSDCRLMVVPGNHDYRYFGLSARTNHAAGFDEAFPGWRNSLLTLKSVRPVAVFCLDSNTNDALVNAARGCVGKAEYSRFQREFDQLRRSDPVAFDRAFKIVVLHHHPLPIADAEDMGFFTTDRFLGLDDAGIFMREMASHEIDLVLHGHKHYTFNARIQLAVGQLFRELTILAAGSASKSGHGENSFNVITITPRTVGTKLLVRTTGVSFFERQQFWIQSYAQFREWAFCSFVKDEATKLEMDRTVLSYSVLEYGDADVSYERQGIRCKLRDSVKSLPVRLECEHGTFADYRIVSKDPVNIQFKADPEAKDNILGDITFDPALDRQTDAIGFEETYRLYNAFALTQEQRRRMSGAYSPEKVVVRFKNPVKEVVVCVNFAKTELPSGIRPVAYADDDESKSDRDELRSCKLHVSKLTKTATFTITKPLKETSYGIEWDLPEGSRSRLSAFRLGQCEEIRQKLLELDTENLNLNPIQPLFRERHRQLSEEYKTPAGKLHFGLMVYDETKRGLRYVAGRIENAFWNYRLLEGQGVAGRAHKLKSALIYVPRRIAPNMAFASAPPPGHAQPQIIVCVPLRFPVPQAETDDAGEVIGVVTLSTTYLASELLKVDEDENRQKALPFEFQIFFLGQILPALGLWHFVDSSDEK